MPGPSIQFDKPDLARHIETLSQSELNAAPFGIILIDGGGTVKFYSETEARLSGYGKSALGLNFYDLCKRFGDGGFRGRIDAAMDKGPVDLEFAWTGDYADPKRDLRIRVQSASTGGVWIFIERDRV